jgi:hypothetical protein
MVGTTRRTIHRPRRESSQFTDEILQAFGFLVMLPPCKQDPPRCSSCPRCREFYRLDRFLSERLGGKPWEVPFVSSDIGAHPEARRRWDELSDALAEATEANIERVTRARPPAHT